LGQVEEEKEVPEDYKLFFEYLKDSMAVSYMFRDLLQEISYMTWASDKFDGSEKTAILQVLGQVEEDYNLIVEAVGTTEMVLQERHEEFDNLRIEAVKELIIVAKGLKDNWAYSWVFERLDKIQKKLHEAIEDFVVGLGHRIKDQGNSGNNGNAVQVNNA